MSIVFIPDFAEEVDAVRAREERCSDGVNRRVTPALFIHKPQL
jgi:hypothetical protein